jgi:hypothetical protein
MTDALVNAAGAVAGAVVSTVQADVRSKLRVLTIVCLFASAVTIVQWVSGRQAGFPVLRNIGLSLVGAYVGMWSAARTLAQNTD